MKITESEHDQIIQTIQEFQKKLDDMGVATGIISINCDLEDIGWLPVHFSFGDPMSADGLAWDFLNTPDDDDDDFIIGMVGPDGDGDAEGEAWKS
jgi:hypothetical protein